MTTTVDITLVRGDSKIKRINVIDDEVPPAPVNITGAIARYAAKRDLDDPNGVVGSIYKTSYDHLQIEIDDPVNGGLLLKYEKSDSLDIEPCCLAHDLELTRQGEPRPAAAIVGTLAVVAGSKTITGTGTALTKLHRGDYIIPAGAAALNQKPVLIVKILSDTAMLTDYDAWSTESGFTFTAFVGVVDTVMDGKLTITKDATT